MYLITILFCIKSKENRNFRENMIISFVRHGKALNNSDKEKNLCLESSSCFTCTKQINHAIT